MKLRTPSSQSHTLTEKDGPRALAALFAVERALPICPLCGFEHDCGAGLAGEIRHFEGCKIGILTRRELVARPEGAADGPTIYGVALRRMRGWRPRSSR